MEMDALTRIAKRNPSIDPTAIDRSQQAAKHVAAVGLKLGSYWLEPALGGKPVPGAGRLFECDSSVRDVGPCGPSQHCGVPRSAPGHADNRAPGTTKSDGLCPRRASSIVSDPRGGQPRMAMKVELTSPMPLSRRGFSTWWPSWTGRPVACSCGGCRTRWTRRSAWTPWTDPLGRRAPEILNTDRAPSSPARRSRTGCWGRAWRSRWTAGAASTTTSSSRGCGGR